MAPTKNVSSCRAGAEDAGIDEGALARLEALQKQQMKDMFGFDYDQEEQEKADRRQRFLEEQEQKRQDRLMRAVAPAQEEGKKRKRRKGQPGQTGQNVNEARGKEPGGQDAGRERRGNLFGEEFGLSQRASAGMTATSVAAAERLRLDRAKELERERANFMSSKISKLYDPEKKEEVVRGRKFRKETGDTEMISAARIVNEVGASSFVGREKKAWELQRLKALGAKAPKNEKVPIFILKGMRAKGKEREKKRKEYELQTGMAVKKPKKKGPSKSINSLNTSGVMRVNMKMKPTGGGLNVGRALQNLGRANKSKSR
jgi:hypothetical protein